MYAFKFLKPKTLDDAIAALNTEGAQALGGGQTLLPTMKQRLAQPELLVSLTDVPELRHVTRGDGSVTIGGGVTHADIARLADYPALASMAAHIGDPAVRNRGTLGGSVANNDPAACYPAAVLGSDAVVITNARSIPAGEFFEGLFATALEEGEIITAIRFPIPARASYQKFVQPASRFALVGVFVAQADDGVRVAVTGASEDGVFRWTEAEQALTDHFVPEALDGLALNADGMMSDIHAGADYRAHLVAVMARRAVAAA